jgi:hypothetical protein
MLSCGFVVQIRIILKYSPARSYVKFALWDGHFQFPTDKTKTDFLEDHIKKKKIISYMRCGEEDLKFKTTRKRNLPISFIKFGMKRNS